MTDGRFHDGDVYCPRCWSWNVAVDFTFEDSFWFCDACHSKWDWDHDGVDWVWPNDVDKPTPGCPWCGTQNLKCEIQKDDDERFGNWSCVRALCGKTWYGRYRSGRRSPSGRWVAERWTIRIPARDVSFRRTLDNPTTYPHHQETP